MSQFPNWREFIRVGQDMRSQLPDRDPGIRLPVSLTWKDWDLIARALSVMESVAANEEKAATTRSHGGP